MNDFLLVGNLAGRLIGHDALAALRGAFTWSGGELSWQHLGDGFAVLSRVACPVVVRRAEFAVAADARIDGFRSGEIPGDSVAPTGIPGASGDLGAWRVAEAFARWGSGCVHRLVGDYAIAAVQPTKRKVLLFRDPFSKRSLFYGIVDDWVFASTQLKPLLAIRELSSRICERSIANFLLFGFHCVPDKDLTGFAAIRAVKPGACLAITSSGVETEALWEFPTAHNPLRGVAASSYPDAFRAVLKRAVVDRVTDGRVAVSMSGGLDSTSVAALLAEYRDEDRRDLEISALTNAGGEYDNEAVFARQVAARHNLRHFVHDVSRYRLFEPWEPSCTPSGSILPQAVLESSRQLSALASTVFVGDAADNVLNGTNISLLQMVRGWGVAATLSNLRSMTPRERRNLSLGTGFGAILNAVGSRGKSPATATLPFPRWIRRSAIDRLDLEGQWEAFWSPPANQRHPFHADLQEAVMWPDWGHRVEFANWDLAQPDVVDPFLDVRVIQFLLSVPPMPWLRGKRILRDAMRTSLPEAVARRAKTPAGDTLSVFLARADLNLVNDFQSRERLDEWIDFGSVPRIGSETDATQNFLAIRIAIIGRWLKFADRINESAIALVGRLNKI